MVVDTAIPCGLILNELISNSLKHAFPDERNGKIKVAFHQFADREYELVVSDDGVGLPEKVNLSRTTSLGMHLVYLIIEQLNGQMEVFREKGTCFRIRFSEYQEADTDIM